MTLKECFILAHDHSPLVTLHSVECLGVELGLLARVTPRETQALADAVCELAGRPIRAGGICLGAQREA